MNCGTYSKKSFRINRAVIGSPPVSDLIRDSAHLRPRSVSDAITKRAPLSIANSVGWRSLLLANSSERHPTELAMLRGARLVIASETERGRRWAESRIKSLTGGDPITARFMRKDFFEYVPQFTLLVAGNHKLVVTRN